ncbi:hypothetical protein [Acidocella sp.]|uniref:hypothetical protein n=1 Tax=Acidocella sp. TaxID=50710 RepID=UPI00261FE808|nr:hypothetical protein [Acidocella sp.]
MNDITPSAPAAPPAPAKAHTGHAIISALLGTGLVLLGAGEGYLWYTQRAHQADGTQLAILQTQVEDLRTAFAHTAPPPDSLQVQANLAQKLLDLGAQLTALQTQEAADHGQLTQMQANSADLGQLTQRLTLLNALETARLALESGRPLGTIPNAPPALAPYATTPLPTMAQLQETFPAAAEAGLAASVSETGQASVWARVKLRLESLITISNGPHVLFGPPAAAAITQARAALRAGDLQGAVSALQTLPPGTLGAMAPWPAQAQAVLAAQAALIGMAQAD